METNSNTSGSACLQYVHECPPWRMRNSCGISFFRIAICASEFPSNKKSSSPQSIYQRTDLVVLSGVFLINSFTEYFEKYFDTNVSLIVGLSLFRLFFASSKVSGPHHALSGHADENNSGRCSA